MQCRVGPARNRAVAVSFAQRVKGFGESDGGAAPTREERGVRPSQPFEDRSVTEREVVQGLEREKRIAGHEPLVAEPMQ